MLRRLLPIGTFLIFAAAMLIGPMTVVSAAPKRNQPHQCQVIPPGHQPSHHQWLPPGIARQQQRYDTQGVCPYCGQRDDRYRSDRRDRDNDRYRADRRDRDDDRQNRNEDERYWENRRYQEGQYRPMGTYDWQTPRKQRRFDGQSYDTGTRWDQQYGTTHQTNRKSR